jgi:hypothetical protein
MGIFALLAKGKSAFKIINLLIVDKYILRRDFPSCNCAQKSFELSPYIQHNSCCSCFFSFQTFLLCFILQISGSKTNIKIHIKIHDDENGHSNKTTTIAPSTTTTTAAQEATEIQPDYEPFAYTEATPSDPEMTEPSEYEFAGVNEDNISSPIGSKEFWEMLRQVIRSEVRPNRNNRDVEQPPIVMQPPFQK